MREETFQQFAIVQGDSAQSLTEQLNAKLYELRFKHPTVTFEGLIARICYTEDSKFAESSYDAFELKGVNLTCEDCPMLQPVLTRKGVPNKVVKYGDCPYAERGRTFKSSRACDVLFQMLSNGEVKLCLAEESEK